jgi:hypothetical protein
MAHLGGDPKRISLKKRSRDKCLDDIEMLVAERKASNQRSA